MDHNKNRAVAFDFDHWAALAQADPSAFEAQRQSAIDELIATAPGELRRRLRGLQFRIDLERRRARTPLKACLRISTMMWDSLLGEDGLIPTLQGMAGGDQPPRATRMASGSDRPVSKIVPFPRPKPN